MRDWHGDVGLALGDDHLVGLVAHDGHRLALEPGHQVLVVVMMVVMMVVVMVVVMVVMMVVMMVMVAVVGDKKAGIRRRRGCCR